MFLLAVRVTVFLTLFSISVFGQGNLSEKTSSIVAEGKLLHQLEMASWFGTDLFLETYQNKNNIGGYFSYLEDGRTKCVFFSNAEDPKIIGAISFDSTYNLKTATTDFTERTFTHVENDLYQIRKITLEALTTNKDGFFKFYENMRPNIIPLINEREKKVYVLTGPQQHNVVIFGNDYLLTFDKHNELLAKKQLHKNIIPIEYDSPKDGKVAATTMHSHLPETGDFITATDICTLMLYERFAKWKTHHVVSQEYLNIWDCEKDQLSVVPMKTIEKINKQQKTKR